MTVRMTEAYRGMFVMGGPRDAIREKVVKYIASKVQANRLVYMCLPSAYWSDARMLDKSIGRKRELEAYGFESDYELRLDAMRFAQANFHISHEFSKLTKQKVKYIASCIKWGVEDLEYFNCGWLDFVGPVASDAMQELIEALPLVFDPKAKEIPFCFSWMQGRETDKKLKDLVDRRGPDIGRRIYARLMLRRVAAKYGMYYKVKEITHYRGMGNRVYMMNVIGSFVRK